MLVHLNDLIPKGYAFNGGFDKGVGGRLKGSIVLLMTGIEMVILESKCLLKGKLYSELEND